MGIVILLDENENVVNIDFNLLDEFNFKNNVVGDVLFIFAGPAIFPFIPQVLIAAEIVLKVTLTQNLISGKVIKRNQQIPHPQYCAKQHNKVFLALFSGNRIFR